jgi:hypothetical protein
MSLLFNESAELVRSAVVAAIENGRTFFRGAPIDSSGTTSCHFLPLLLRFLLVVAWLLLLLAAAAAALFLLRSFS